MIIIIIMKKIFQLSDNEYNIDNFIYNENEENDFSSSNYNSCEEL